MSASHAGQQLLGLCGLIVELGINVVLPMQVEIASQAAIRHMEKEEIRREPSISTLSLSSSKLVLNEDRKAMLCEHRRYGS